VKFSREPALWLGLLGAVISLGVSFGLKLTAQQTGAVVSVAQVILAIAVRQSVVPAWPAKVAEPAPLDPTLGHSVVVQPGSPPGSTSLNVSA
jgi:hypothetical protein